MKNNRIEEKYYSLEELQDLIGVDAHLIIEFVQYGVVKPMDMEEKTWHFPVLQMHKLQRALRLQHDLELNTAGVALALDLLEELESMRLEVKQLQQELALFHIEYK